jgi:integrase/recombinase XerD
MKQITFSQAIDGYTLDAEARRLSPRTLADYSHTFRKFRAFLNDDPPITSITTRQIKRFLASQDGISGKTLLNYHTGLSALWTWAVREGYADRHIVREVSPPKPEERAVLPFTEEDLRAMLAVLDESKPYRRLAKRECTHSLPHIERNRAIILLLVDTGIRSIELRRLRIFQIDMRNRRIAVEGKGAKERIIPFSARTGKSIWQYLITRPDRTPADYAFITSTDLPFTRRYLAQLISRIGERAGVQDAHPHRFRHTFAINFLRNGGDPYALQMALGHSTMEMTRKYLFIAQADLAAAHRQASPVDNWRL